MYILWSTLLQGHLKSFIVSVGSHWSVPAAWAVRIFCVAFPDINFSLHRDISYLWNNNYISSYHFSFILLISFIKKNVCCIGLLRVGKIIFSWKWHQWLCCGEDWICWCLKSSLHKRSEQDLILTLDVNFRHTLNIPTVSHQKIIRS